MARRQRHLTIPCEMCIRDSTDTDMAKGLQKFRWVRAMTAGRVAQSLVKGLKQNRSEILVGWQSHLAVWCQRFALQLLERVLLLATPQSV